MTLVAVVNSSGIHALGWTLLHFLWQGCLIAALLALVLAALPHAAAQARYAACCCALTSMLVAPLGTLLRQLGVDRASTPSLGTLGVGHEGLAAPSAPAPLLATLGAAWALGSLVMSVRLAVGLLRLRHLVEQAIPVPDAWQRRLGALGQRIGLARPVRLVASAATDAPLTLGWMRPLVVLPIGVLGSLPAAYVEAILLHELAHVRRLDYLVNVIQAAAEALLYYHPAVHWVSRCMRLEREHCCDDVAITALNDPLGYARALTAMEAWRAPVPRPALGSNGGSLLGRIARIVERPPRQRATRASTLIGAVAIVGGLTLGAAWAQAGSEDEAASRPGSGVDRSLESASLGVAWLPPALQRWQPLLAAAAERHGVDPALLAIVALVESLGNPAAHSPNGAVGLMQVMPTTAAAIASDRALDDYTEERLWDPDYNVDFGAWYLSRQLAEFGPDGISDHSVALAAIAYNGGPRLARACGAGRLTLPEPVRRYRDLVVGLWRERAQHESPTFVAWRAQLGAMRVAPETWQTRLRQLGGSR